VRSSLNTVANSAAAMATTSSCVAVGAHNDSISSRAAPSTRSLIDTATGSLRRASATSPRSAIRIAFRRRCSSRA
jgi:hypothetical protein